MRILLKYAANSDISEYAEIAYSRISDIPSLKTRDVRSLKIRSVTYYKSSTTDGTADGELATAQRLPIHYRLT